MMLSMQPFTPGKPIEQDHLFVDQERVIDSVCRCLNKGRSCSIIGGVGMGKTSVLKRIQRMFSQQSDVGPRSSFRFIPIYFKPDLRKVNSLRDIYAQLVGEVISQTEDWLIENVADVPEIVLDDLKFTRRLIETGVTTPDEDIWAFEGDLWETIKAIRYAVANAKLVFLLDDLYRIEDADIKETVAMQWFRLLDEENIHQKTLRSHVAVVITCFKDHLEQFIRRSPKTVPIRNAIEPIYLNVFEPADARRVMMCPFESLSDVELPEKVLDAIYNLTGGHLLLLQSVMSDLWVDIQMEKQIDVATVQGYFSSWSERHPEMYRWIGDIISENQMLRPVFDLLVSGDKAWQRSKLIEALKGSPANLRYNHHLRDALRILKSLGVVCEVRKHVYQISGELFREWFEPLSEARVDENNYKSQIDELTSQIKDKLESLNEYRDVKSVSRIRSHLKEDLTTLETDRVQLIDLDKSLAPGNPMREDIFRRLIKEVQNIKYYIHFELDLQLADLGIQLE